MVSTTYLWWFGGWFNYYCFNHITIFGGNSDPYISARLGWAAGSQAFEAPKSPGPDRKTPRRPDVSETWKEHDGSMVFVDGGQNKADPNQDLTSHHMRCQGYDFEGNHLPWQTVHTGATPPGTKDGMSCTRTVDLFQCVFGVSMGLRCFLDSHEIAGVSSVCWDWYDPTLPVFVVWIEIANEIDTASPSVWYSLVDIGKLMIQRLLLAS